MSIGLSVGVGIGMGVGVGVSNGQWHSARFHLSCIRLEIEPETEMKMESVGVWWYLNLGCENQESWRPRPRT